MSTTRDVFLGLDIGGTKIGMSIGTPDGRVLVQDRMDVDHAKDPGEILAVAKSKLDAMLASRGAAGSIDRVLAIGAACPGPLDYALGKFINPPNNPRWHGFGLRDWLKANFTCPRMMMNDANAAALAEWLWGAAKGHSSAVFLTMSTGMGAGLVLDNRLYEGPLGLAGEIGRLRLRDTDDGPVGFGRRGSVEGYTSGPGMVQLAISEAIACIHTNQRSRLVDVYKSRGTIDTRELCDAARAGDAAAKRVTDRVALELGRLMAIMTDILNPEVFVLGTIGTAYPDLFIPGAERMLKAEALESTSVGVRVVPSTLPDRGNQQALAVAWQVTESARR